MPKKILLLIFFAKAVSYGQQSGECLPHCDPETGRCMVETNGIKLCPETTSDPDPINCPPVCSSNGMCEYGGDTTLTCTNVGSGAECALGCTSSGQCIFEREVFPGALMGSCSEHDTGVLSECRRYIQHFK